MFLGVHGWIPEIHEACEIAAEKFDQRIECYDTFEGHAGGSVLDAVSPVPFASTPPTIHDHAEIYRGWPDLTELDEPLNLVVFARDDIGPIETVRWVSWVDEAVFLGRHARLRELAKSLKLRYQPLAWFEDYAVVRAVSPE